MSSLLPFWGAFYSLFVLHYSLTSSLLAKFSLILTEVGPEETFSDVGTRLSKAHGVRGQLILHTPGEARELQKYESQRVRDVFPDQTSFQFSFIPDQKPVEPEAPVVTDGHNLYVRGNTSEGHAEQDNVLPYPAPPVGRVAVSVTAGIQGNRATGNSKQRNQIGGHTRGRTWFL